MVPLEPARLFARHRPPASLFSGLDRAFQPIRSYFKFLGKASKFFLGKLIGAIASCFAATGRESAEIESVGHWRVSLLFCCAPIPAVPAYTVAPMSA